MHIEELLTLSKIFKQGFTVEYKEGIINQYTNYDKPFIVSYLPLIEIKTNEILYHNIQQISNNCIIGGWHDSDTNTYYIELNIAFSDKMPAYVYAKTLNQKAIYDIRTGDIMEV